MWCQHLTQYYHHSQPPCILFKVNASPPHDLHQSEHVFEGKHLIQYLEFYWNSSCFPCDALLFVVIRGSGTFGNLVNIKHTFRLFLHSFLFIGNPIGLKQLDTCRHLPKYTILKCQSWYKHEPWLPKTEQKIGHRYPSIKIIIQKLTLPVCQELWLLLFDFFCNPNIDTLSLRSKPPTQLLKVILHRATLKMPSLAWLMHFHDVKCNCFPVRLLKCLDLQ